jgi:hypothetical protein
VCKPVFRWVRDGVEGLGVSGLTMAFSAFAYGQWVRVAR